MYRNIIYVIDYIGKPDLVICKITRDSIEKIYMILITINVIDNLVNSIQYHIDICGTSMPILNSFPFDLFHSGYIYDLRSI